MLTLTSPYDYFLFACTQYKRHRTKQHTRNFAKSVVNLVDAVSKPLQPSEKCAVFALRAMKNVHTLRRWCLYYRRRFISVFSSCINHHVDTWCCCSLFSMCNTALLIVTLMILNGPYSLSPCAQMFLQMISNPCRPSGLLRQINMSLNSDISLSKMHIFYRWGPDTEFLIAQTPTHRYHLVQSLLEPGADRFLNKQFLSVQRA